MIDSSSGVLIADVGTTREWLGYICLAALLSCCSWSIAGSAIEVKHSASTAATVISWKDDQSTPESLYSIYRSDEPINEQTVAFARLIAARVKWSPEGYSYHVPDSGEHYYAVFGRSIMGKEDRQFGRNISQAIIENGANKPLPPQVVRAIQSGTMALNWRRPERNIPALPKSYRLYSKVSGSDQWKLDTEIDERKLEERGKQLSLRLSGENLSTYRDYQVTALDAAGNESEPSNIVRVSRGADLAVSSESLIARNPDVSISKMYPPKGEAARFEVNVHNYGGEDADNVPIKVTALPEGGSAVPVAELNLKSVASYEASRASFTWIPPMAGRWRLKVQIGSQTGMSQSKEVDLDVCVPEHDICFLWYGSSPTLAFANVLHPVLPRDMAEWKRRGASPFALLGTGGDAVEHSEEGIRMGLVGACFDEIGKTSKDLAGLLKMFPEIKGQHPEFFIACWQIGDYDEDSIVSLKKGDFDLLVVECYLHLGKSPISKLEQTIENLQRLGISRKAIIGLGIGREYAPGSAVEDQIAFLQEQMKIIRKKGPEMPGVAFFAYEAADPKVIRSVDQLCSKLFFTPVIE